MSWTCEYYECSGCGEIYACAYKTCPTCHAPCRPNGKRVAGRDISSGAELVVTGDATDAERIFLRKAMRFKRNDGRIESAERAQLVDFANEFGISPLRREDLIEQVECEYESGSASAEVSLATTQTPVDERSFGDFVLETARVLEADENIFLKGAMPTRKISGACKAIMPGGKAQDILVLVDNTVFGGATDGVVLTYRGVWLKNIMEKSRLVRWDEISSVVEDGTDLHVGCYKVDLTVLSKETVKMLADVIRTISTASPRKKPDHTDNSIYDWAVGVCSSLAHNNDVYVGHNILARKITAGMDSMGVQEGQEDVFMQIDTTVFGGAKEGVILTPQAIYWKNIMEKACRVNWRDFRSAQVVEDASVLLNGFKKIELEGSFSKSDTANFVKALKELGRRFKNCT